MHDYCLVIIFFCLASSTDNEGNALNGRASDENVPANFEGNISNHCLLVDVLLCLVFFHASLFSNKSYFINGSLLILFLAFFTKHVMVELGARVHEGEENCRPSSLRRQYDRNVRIEVRSHEIQLNEPIQRQSQRNIRPCKHFNYGVVKCSVCGRSYFCEAMSTELYSGRIACSAKCVAKSEK